jgi:hypothetical protein
MARSAAEFFGLATRGVLHLLAITSCIRVRFSGRLMLALALAALWPVARRCPASLIVKQMPHSRVNGGQESLANV